ncbi:MAG: TetR/AcrR family transcriptional regulator, partial [Solirubrobacterales bacterium]
ESFDGRDALLRAVHAQVADQARDAIVAAVAAHVAAGGEAEDESLAYEAVAAFTAFLEEDPRRGRVLLSESFSDTVLARHDIELVPAFAALLVAQITALPDGPDAIDAELTAVALIGALRNLYLAWMEGRSSLSTERLNAHAARLIIAAARVSSRAD